MKFAFGPEEYLVNQEVKKFLKSFSVKANLYDELATIEMIIMDIATIAMFSEQKVIIVKDHPLFTDHCQGQKFLNEFKELVRKDVNLLFVLTSKPNHSNPFVKYLLKNAEVKEVKMIHARDLPNIIRDVVQQNGGHISSGAIIKLLQKFPVNLRLIINETKKLLIENKNITEKQVDQSVDNYYSEDYFALSNAIIDLNKNAIIKYYNEKLTYGQKPVAIIGQLVATFNLSILINSYKKQGLRLQDIANKLQMHIFRIKKANELLMHQSVHKISDLIVHLADLEFNIKAGNANNTRELDRFILKLIK